MSDKMTAKEIILDNEIEIGEIVLDIQKVYPELEEAVVQSTTEEQVVKPTKYGFSKVIVKPKEILLKDIEITQNGVYEVPDSFDGFGKIIVNIKGGSSGLTDEQIEALNNAKVYFEDGNLILEYDDSILDIDFNIENNELIVENNINNLDFNIENNELEATY